MLDEQFDIEKFIDLFDTAMTSDNPTVRRAFKNLLIVAALVDSETPPRMAGPLRGLYKQIDELRDRVSKIEITKKPYGPVTMPGITTNNPTWIVNDVPTFKYTVDTSGTTPYGISSAKLNSIYNGLDKDNE